MRLAHRTIVLVHGAWAGAWCWVRVVDRLTARGHHVYTPTLTGLGERSHLVRCDVNLTTHIHDVVNEIVWKDLNDVVLVGHSYSGMVITGVADQVPNRIAAVVYMDAALPHNGESFADLAQGLSADGATIPAPESAEGDYVNDADRAWVDGKATPQPSATFTEKMRVSGAYLRVPNKVYVRATRGPEFFAAIADSLRADPEWSVYDVESGHDVELDAPDELCEILERAIT